MKFFTAEDFATLSEEDFMKQAAARIANEALRTTPISKTITLRIVNDQLQLAVSEDLNFGELTHMAKVLDLTISQRILSTIMPTNPNGPGGGQGAKIHVVK